MNREMDCVIVGAGISGLVLARRLEAAGLTVVILEKSKGVGGRMATRRDHAATYDHGAQFYKVSNQVASELDEIWSRAKITSTWFRDEKSDFKSAEGGMTRLAKHLAQNLNIALEQKVISISNTNEVHCESGRVFKGKHIFFSSPLPQSLEILRVSQIEYPKALESIEYASALVGLFEVVSTSESLTQIKYLQNVDTDIFSISNQLSKRVSLCLAYTVVMRPEWSRRHFEDTESGNLQKIADLFSNYLKTINASFTIKKQQLKKWRFSHPTSHYPTPYVVVGSSHSIFLLGDAFGGPSLHGAVSSAEAVPIPV